MLVFSFIYYFPRKVLGFFIFLYQKLFSPDHSFIGKFFWPNGYCKYYPSCSEYGKIIVKRRGVFIGIFKIALRILRCNPWSKGGVDLP